MFAEFMKEYGFQILSTVIIAIFGYLGIVAKRLINTYLDNEQKRHFAKVAVQAVEQIYQNLHGEEKLEKAIDYITVLLGDAGIEVSNLEMRMLVESAVKEMNMQIGDFLKEPFYFPTCSHDSTVLLCGTEAGGASNETDS